LSAFTGGSLGCQFIESLPELGKQPGSSSEVNCLRVEVVAPDFVVRADEEVLFLGISLLRAFSLNGFASPKDGGMPGDGSAVSPIMVQSSFGFESSLAQPLSAADSSSPTIGGSLPANLMKPVHEIHSLTFHT
jgi:hypothetical protein